MENQEKDLQVEKIKKEIEEVIDLDLAEKIVEDNKVEFIYKDTTYRVSKPNFEQKQEANRQKIIKYTQLIKDENYLLEADLIKLYQKRGIDVKEMENKYSNLERAREEYLFKLGKAITEKAPEDQLVIYKNELDKIIEEQKLLDVKRATLLENSIETQVKVFSYLYLAYSILEKKVEDKWIKAFDDYDAFIREDEIFINKVVWYTSLLAKNDLS